MQFTQFGELCIKPNACLELQNFLRVSACVLSKLDWLQLSTIDYEMPSTSMCCNSEYSDMQYNSDIIEFAV